VSRHAAFSDAIETLAKCYALVVDYSDIRDAALDRVRYTPEVVDATRFVVEVLRQEMLSASEYDRFEWLGLLIALRSRRYIKSTKKGET
jgi:hypothetical protein